MKCLKNHLKQNKNFYDKFLKKRSHKKETEYRNFKTLFDIITRTSKKSYYSNLVEKHKNDI